MCKADATFEAYLRLHGVGFIAVGEANRSMLGDADVKSLDFIIVGPNDAKLVVDVKGRKFPGGSAERPVMTWQNWSTQDDIDGLERWAKVLGPDYRGVLAFAYEIQPPFVLPNDTRDLFTFRGQTYLMRAVEVSAYREHMRRRSPKWGTVGLPVAAFRKIVRPFTEFLAPAPVLQS